MLDADRTGHLLEEREYEYGFTALHDAISKKEWDIVHLMLRESNYGGAYGVVDGSRLLLVPDHSGLCLSVCLPVSMQDRLKSI